MASLRDVLNHVGRKVVLERHGAVVAEGLGIVRGTQAFVEPQLDPKPGDELRWVDSDQRFRVVAAAPEEIRGRVDHVKVDVAPLAASP